MISISSNSNLKRCPTACVTRKTIHQSRFSRSIQHPFLSPSGFREQGYLKNTKPTLYIKRRQLTAHQKNDNATTLLNEETETPPPTNTSMPVTDNWLGRLFLRLLPGWSQYCLVFVMPVTVVAAAVSVIYGPQLMLYVANTAFMSTHMRPVASLLTVLATQQPWAGLTKLTLSLLTGLYAFLLMPLLDFVLGNDLTNPTPEEASAAAHNNLYRFILYAYVPIAYTVCFTVCHLICTTHTLSPWAFFGVALSCGVSNGILFTVAHELLHGAQKLDRTLAGVLLANVCYGHWSKSHLIHHIKVATKEDPSSARKGESLYAFIPRSVLGNVVDGYAAEAKRLKTKGIEFWNVKENRMFQWIGGPGVIASGVCAVWGVKGLVFWLTQAVVGVLMLETVNYIEHYGLTRHKAPTTHRYERVKPNHSWNSSTIFTNSVTFKLQRHSDHHAHDNRPYQILETVRDAPQLPAGYPAMMLLSLVPPLFFRVMDPGVEMEERKYISDGVDIGVTNSWEVAAA